MLGRLQPWRDVVAVARKWATSAQEVLGVWPTLRETVLPGLVSHWEARQDVVIGGPSRRPADGESLAGFTEFEAAHDVLDAMSYLPDDILVKVDRAAMGVSPGNPGSFPRPSGGGIRLEAAAVDENSRRCKVSGF